MESEVDELNYQSAVVAVAAAGTLAEIIVTSTRTEGGAQRRDVVSAARRPLITGIRDVAVGLLLHRPLLHEERGHLGVE